MAGQIIPRGKGVWLVRIFLERDANGKQRFFHKTIHGSKRDAEAYAAGALRDRSMGVDLGSKATVDDLLEALKLDYKINGKDYDWAERIVRVDLMPNFGKMRIARVTTDVISQYIAKRQAAGLANATINRELSLLKRAFNLGHKCTPPKVARVPYFPHLAENNVRKGFLEDSQYRLLLEALPEYLRPVLAFAYYTGCRKAEILSVQWQQVDLVERIVRLEPGTTKNDEARDIPLVPELHEMLVLQRQKRDQLFPDCPWVFFDAEGEQIGNFRSDWASACTAAGLVDAEGEPTVIFHDLRRTGVRNLVRAGVPEAVAMQISGHKTRSIFDRYNIVSGADRKEAARRLAEYISERRKRDQEEAEKANLKSCDTIVIHGAKKRLQ